MNAPVLNRRSLLAGSGALIVSFSLGDALAQDQTAPATPPSPPPAPPPGSLKGAPYLDSWIRIDADGGITVFTGKAELGQGAKTAFIETAARVELRYEGVDSTLSVPFQPLPDMRAAFEAEHRRRARGATPSKPRVSRATRS